MLVHSKLGNEIELEIDGSSAEDDISVHSAVYVDSGNEVDAETLEYVLDTYAAELHTEWFELQIDRAERWRDSQQDR